MAMSERVSGTWWVENLLRPMLIAGMFTCLAAPAVVLLECIAEGWNGTYLLGFVFLACLEGILSERALHKQRISGWGYLGSRGAELLVLLIVLKLANYIPLGLDQLLTAARGWTVHPESLVTNLDLLTAAVFVPLWAGALYVARMATELDVQQRDVEPPADKTSAAYYMWLTQPSSVRDRQERLDWLGEVFLWGGFLLLIAAAGIHFLLPTMQVPAVPTLLYFALGIALLSQARFSVTHTGWLIQSIPVQANIGRRWLFWVAIFLVGVALLASLLPTAYAMGPVQALMAAIGAIAQLVTLVFGTLYLLLMLLLSFLFPSVEPKQPTPQVVPPAPPSAPGSAGSPFPWLEVVVSILFWTTILGIVSYALVRFLRERFGLFERGEGRGTTWWGRFLAWMRAVWRQFWSWQQEVQGDLTRRLAERWSRQSPAARLFRFLSLRGLSPRELVRYFYLSAERRAAGAGQPRRPDQTPYEYQSSLTGHFPDLEPDLTGLTEAFVQARYNRRPVQPEDAEAVKPLWERIKTALRRRRVPDAPDQDPVAPVERSTDSERP
jgi:hypothetical protein